MEKNKEVAEGLGITKAQWNLGIVTKWIVLRFAGVNLREDEDGYLYMEIVVVK